MNKPLSGIKVLELATFVAAPSCCRLLADLGAEVIKVEHPKGDGWRPMAMGLLPNRFTPEENPVFDIYNSGKEHIAINLKSEKGMEAFHKLLAQADVFVTNSRPAALHRLGLAYEDIKEKYPSLIYAIILGYGEKGPDAAMPAFDTTAFWSRSGFLRDMAVNMDGYMPVNAPSAVGDTAVGYLLLAEICAALYKRKETGKGDYLRSGLFHNAIFTMGTMQIITQRPFGREYPMTRARYGSPNGAFQCADGEWIFMAPGAGSAGLDTVCDMVGHPDLLSDPRFNTVAGRKEHYQEWYEIFRDAIAKKSCAEWIKLGKERDVAITRMGTFADLAEDEQAWANDYLEHVEFPNGNVDVMPRSPIEMDSVGMLTTKLAHGIGADTQKILKELGYAEEEIAAMQADGAVK